MVLSVLSALLVVGVGSPASAATASPDPSNLTCADPSATGLSTKHGYVSASIPAGATVGFVASGTVYNGPYVATAGGGQYTFGVNVWENGSKVWTNGGYPFVSYGGVLADMPPSEDFSGKDIGAWKNDTGADAQINLDLWAARAAFGKDISWSVELRVSGGSPGSCARVFGSSLFGPNQGMGQQCPSCHGGTDYSVDSLTGNEHWVMPGVSLSARGPGIDFQLAYNSLAAGTDDSIGHGWHDSYDMSLSPGDFGSEVVTQETGATVPFVASGSNWVAPPEYDATLVHNADGTWLFTRHHRELFTFDSSGRLTSIADRNGYTTTLSYAADGLDHVVDDAGHRLNFAWANGHVSTITDVSDPDNPRTMQFTYDAGNLTQFGDIGGGSWPMSYDDSHRLLSVQSPRLVGTSAARQFHYDDQGRVNWEQDAEGQRTSLYYGDPQPGATRILDPAGNARVDYYNDLGQRTSVTSGYGTADASTTQYVYDPATGMVTDRIDGRGKHWRSEYGDAANPFSPTKTTDPAGRIRTISYNAYGDPSLVTDAHGVTTNYEYDANGNPTSITAASGTADAGTVQYVYGDADQPGVPTSIVDARGKTWTFDHDPATGELKRATDPLGNATTWTYNPEGWVSTRVAPKGNAPDGTPTDYTTSYQYNGYGEPKLVTDALGHPTHISYYADGTRKSVTDPTGRETDYTWTDADHLHTVTHGVGTPSARTLTYTYWPDGRVKTWYYRPDSVWSLSWDALGRLTKKTNPNNNSTAYRYNANGQPISTTIAAGTKDASTTMTDYDDDGRPIYITTGYGTEDDVTTDTKYDIAPGAGSCQGGPSNTVYCVSTGHGWQLTTGFYDARDRLVEVNRGGTIDSYSYDAAGLLSTATDTSLRDTRYTYDDAGRLRSSSSADTSRNVSYVYDANGDRRSMTDATGTTQYVFDHDQRLTSVTDAAKNEVNYGFDDAGRPESLKYPDGRLITYSYNGAGQVDSLTDDAAGQQTHFGYNADGALTSTSLPNGDAISTDVDAADQPLKTALTGPAETVLASIGYDHDHAGRISTETDQGALSGSASYGYDALSRLTSATDAGGTISQYGHDQSEDPTTFGATTQTFLPASGELKTSTTSDNTTSFAHDNNGNRTAGSLTTGPDTRYRYDSANRLTSSGVPSANSPGAQYHPLGITRLVDTRSGTGQCTPSPCATLSPRDTLTVQVSGKGGVPTSGVNAVVLNVTAVNSTTSGLLVAYPAGESRPNGRSLSTISGTQQTNAVVTALSADGKVTFYSGANTDLLIDVSGWYSDTDDQTGSVFEPIDGTRIVDTRNGTGYCTDSPCARLGAGETTSFLVDDLPDDPHNDIAAVAFTLTAFDPSKSGYATVWAADQDKPSPRNLSYSASTDSSQLIVAKPSQLGELKLYTSGAADFTVDLAGYYTTGRDGTGSIFVPYDGNSGTQQQRILDTRNGTGDCSRATCDIIGTSTPLTVTVAGHGNVPDDATAAVLSATAWEPTGDGGLVFWSADDSKPSGRNLSYAASATTTGSIQVPLSAEGRIKATALFHSTDLTLDVEGWFEPAYQTTTYTYNGDGLRTTKTDPDKTSTHYTYNPATPVPQLLTDGTTDYIYGPNGSPLESSATTGGHSPTSYYLTDADGSTRALTDSTGAVSGTYNYTPFGAVANHTGTATTPLQYAGGYTDSETGLDYLINRYYDPTTGLFTSIDPLVDVTGTPYTYADNDPINETDPSGECPWCVTAAVGAAAGAGLDLGKQVLGNLSSGCPAFSNISWGEVAEGAVAGALAGATWGLSGEIAAFGAGLEEGVGGAEALATGAESAANAGDHIVLGLRAHGLEETAAKVGGRTLLKDPEWMSSLQKAIGDPSTKFTVSLDGMFGSSTYQQVMGAATRGASGAGGYTDWEMAQLFQGGRLPDVTFVRGGVPVENPWVP